MTYLMMTEKNKKKQIEIYLHQITETLSTNATVRLHYLICFKIKVAAVMNTLYVNLIYDIQSQVILLCCSGIHDGRN